MRGRSLVKFYEKEVFVVVVYVVFFPCVNFISTFFDGVVKTLHPESRRLAYLVRCYIFSIITAYLMYAEIKEKLHASNMKLFEVYAIYLSIQY